MCRISSRPRTRTTSPPSNECGGRTSILRISRCLLSKKGSYVAEGDVCDNLRRDVLDRMWDKVKLAEKADVRLIHENEHRIYGDDPERVKDLMETVLEQTNAAHFGAVYDPANYVFCGFDP